LRGMKHGTCEQPAWGMDELFPTGASGLHEDHR
jgi:hypothetical protein